MVRIFLILSLIFLIEIHAVHRRCINSGVLLPDKIFRSPIIVYGEPIRKRVNVDTDTNLLYNVTFRVDCVFKGQDVENRIEITEAGRANILFFFFYFEFNVFLFVKVLNQVIQLVNGLTLDISMLFFLKNGD